MVYVLRKEEDNNILILPFLPLPVDNSEEEEDGAEQKLLYEFPWDYNSTLPCLRWFALEYGEEKSSVYLPAVLDYLDTIKDLPEPPKEELKRVYQVKSKIDAFQKSIIELEKIGLITRPESYTLTDHLLYETDLYSQYYRILPASLVDLVLDYLDLSTEARSGIKEIWNTKNQGRQEEIRDTLNISPEFLPLSLKIKSGQAENKNVPEYKRKCGLVSEGPKKKEMGIEEFKNSYGLGDEFSFTDLINYGLNITDLEDCFELSRDWRNKTYKITKIL